MAIVFNQQTGVFSLHTKHSTYQMQVAEHGFLLHLYYGRRVDGMELTHLLQKIDRGFSGNPNEAGTDRTFSLDTLPQEYSTFGVGDYRESCIQVIHADGSNVVDLRYRSHEIQKGKYGLRGLPALYDETEAQSETLSLRLEDPYTNLRVQLLYGVFEEQDVITRAVIVENGAQQAVELERALSCCLDFAQNDFDLLTFYGKHCMERMVERTPVRHGKIVADSTRGTSSHQENPFVILCRQGADEEQGECYGMSLLYSGNFTAVTEVDQVNQTRLVMGINPTGFRYHLEPGESFTAPEVALCFSECGLGELSRRYHRIYRSNLCRGYYKDKRRPILINNWEATYFQFDDDKLVDIAKTASKLGIELLVMDDGWFGKRDDDVSGLGDWFVNEGKIKGGLHRLVERINDLGMQFGIWFEPEMVNEDSDLYRAHPDWCLHNPRRPGSRGRYQLVLDMSRRDVIEYLFEAVSGILSSANIAYVKWDMNRHLTNVWSAQLPAHRQGEVYHRYVLGVYELMERLTSAFPKVLFEGCSGGGGRFDAGMLYYTPQIWCSDDTDAIERLSIQYGTSFGYPISTMGSHVSACPNHQTGRCTSFHTRGVVAMSGTFGYELDVNRLSQEEKQHIVEQTDFFKRNYDLISYGDYYRLTNPMENREYAAWQFVSPDQKKALLNYVCMHSNPNPAFIRIRLRGLNPKWSYRIAGDSITYTGAALLYAGLNMPILTGDNQAVQLELEAVE